MQRCTEKLEEGMQSTESVFMLPYNIQTQVKYIYFAPNHERVSKDFTGPQLINIPISAMLFGNSRSRDL